MNQQLWWHLARATGIVSWFVLTLSALWGVALSTRLLAKRATPAWLLDLHRFLGGAAVVLVGLHLVGLVADTYVHFGVADLFVPFASSWRPGAVAAGVVALYLLIAIEVTSLLRRRISTRLWRAVHRSSAALWGLATLHLVAAGTDARNIVLQWGVLAIGMVVVFVTVVRVLSPRPDRAVQRHDRRGSRPRHERSSARTDQPQSTVG